MSKSRFMQKDRRLLAPVVLAGAMVAFGIFTWIGSSWGLNVRNLLSADGVRWFTGNIVNNIEEGPIGLILLLMMTLGAVQESGLWSSMLRGGTLKQHRALSVTILIAVVLFVVLFLLTIGGNGVLMSPFGTIAGSPFLAGLVGLVLIGLILLADVFGYTSGRFGGMTDIIIADVSVIRRLSYYFAGYVLAAEFCACLYFSGVLSDGKWWSTLVEIILYLLPLC